MEKSRKINCFFVTCVIDINSLSTGIGIENTAILLLIQNKDLNIYLYVSKQVLVRPHKFSQLTLIPVHRISGYLQANATKFMAEKIAVLTTQK